MTLHYNSDGTTADPVSVTDGVKTEGPGAFKAHDLSVTCAASATLPGAAAALAAGATTCLFQNDSGSTSNLRYRLDGTAPTAGVGMSLPIGQSLTISINDAVNIKFIQVAATATVNSWYYM